jgi:hypothetical protein
LSASPPAPHASDVPPEGACGGLFGCVDPAQPRGDLGHLDAGESRLRGNTVQVIGWELLNPHVINLRHINNRINTYFKARHFGR